MWIINKVEKLEDKCFARLQSKLWYWWIKIDIRHSLVKENFSLKKFVTFCRSRTHTKLQIWRCESKKLVCLTSSSSMRSRWKSSCKIWRRGKLNRVWREISSTVWMLQCYKYRTATIYFLSLPLNGFAIVTDKVKCISQLLSWESASFCRLFLWFQAVTVLKTRGIRRMW